MPGSTVQDYFYQRLGVALTLSDEESAFYFAFPQYHRDLIEFPVLSDDYKADHLLFKHWLEATIHRESFKELANDLWRLYFHARFSLSERGLLSEVSQLFFPMVGIHHLKEQFRSSIAELAEKDIIDSPYWRAVEDNQDDFLVDLPELEKLAPVYLGVLERKCLQVWRCYLNEPHQLVPSKIKRNKRAAENNPKTSSRAELQIEKINQIKAESPGLTNKQLHQKCMKKYPELFSMEFLSFKNNTLPLWRKSQKDA